MVDQRQTAAPKSSRLASIGAKKVAATAAHASRPSLELTPALELTFQRVVEADAVAELADDRLQQEREALDKGVFELWAHTLWKDKVQPPNPELKIMRNGMVDISAIYQVQAKFRIEKPPVPEGKTLPEVLIEALTDAFVGTGLAEEDSEADATRLVNEELDFTPKKMMRPYNELLEGHYEGDGKNRAFKEATEAEKALGNKVLDLLECRDLNQLDPTKLLTDEEYNELNREVDSVVVKKGFLQRVCTYARSEAQVVAILKIIKPQPMLSGKKFALASDKEEQLRRKLAVAIDILGIKLPTPASQ
jgi:hypothetical protein